MTVAKNMCHVVRTIAENLKSAEDVLYQWTRLTKSCRAISNILEKGRIGAYEILEYLEAICCTKLCLKSMLSRLCKQYQQ